jgi:hypothetical protein
MKNEVKELREQLRILEEKVGKTFIDGKISVTSVNIHSELLNDAKKLLNKETTTKMINEVKKTLQQVGCLF